jgi:acetyltransferase-like isoleucine patch superfamily enzyme
MPPRPSAPPGRAVVAWRIAWTVASLIVVQTLVCGLSAAPVLLAWRGLFAITAPGSSGRWLAASVALVPSYAAFAVLLMAVSPIPLRLFGWRTPPNSELRIADMDWDLLRWVRYVASLHVPRVVAGTLVRGTPIWAAHLRLCGARLGKRVYVNSLAVSDYNLITCGDDVVIGADVHMAGHTVERGVVKTAPVRLGDRVTIGLGAIVEIGVEIESDVQVGALSFVPKHTRLAGGRVYVGAPAAPLDSTWGGPSGPPNRRT